MCATVVTEAAVTEFANVTSEAEFQAVLKAKVLVSTIRIPAQGSSPGHTLAQCAFVAWSQNRSLP